VVYFTTRWWFSREMFLQQCVHLATTQHLVYIKV